MDQRVSCSTDFFEINDLRRAILILKNGAFHQMNFVRSRMKYDAKIQTLLVEAK